MKCEICGGESGQNKVCENCLARIIRAKNELKKCEICGKPSINDLCPQCKTKIETYNKSNINSHNQESIDEIKEKKRNKLSCIIVTLIFLAIGIGTAIFFIKTISPDKVIIPRNANNNDIIVRTNETTISSYGIKITANQNITDLQVTFEFIDENENIIATKIKQIGNVIKNTEYSISFQFSEFSLTEKMAIAGFRATVTGGTVKP